MIIALDDARTPTIAPEAWIASSAVVVGAVTVGTESGVWYNAVVRADDEAVIIGPRTNVQDGSVIHADPGSPATIGGGVSIGHNATIHGCTIGDNVLIGMGATVMNNAEVGEDSLVAAGALVPERTVIPPRSLVAGVPAKIRRTLTDDEVDGIRANAAHYVTKRSEHAVANPE
ncbi:gamma carbonic anhydrase family protein [Saccharopolyspora karakumensis]|uniref:Gamma carbonic anhydrase family protein n=1 Tax=Saccharopolyspora karakumensis TaxID=2530386 RepID=A0A4R5BSC6_9PSEU|nr:gamma carbonic anhydrase family protein [Saccharopolyspora karakumensis]TDD87042.1 gamma carbonic anhydrase family protein [Saccharopolyspora karakumensis]